MKRRHIKRTFQLLLLAALVAAIAMRTFSTGTAPDTSYDILEWDRAIEHIGEFRTVRGPVVDTHYAQNSPGSPTFLNIGKPYPETPRFTVVIWGEDRDSFLHPPEHEYRGRRIAVSGIIGYYDGSAQIVADNPNAIETTE